MKIHLNLNDIADRLRADQHAGWSHAGANILAEHLDENENEDEEFDLVAIRCGYAEYESASLAAEDYGWEFIPWGKGCLDEAEVDEETKNQSAWEWLEKRTLVLEVIPHQSFFLCGSVIIRTNF